MGELFAPPSRIHRIGRNKLIFRVVKHLNNMAGVASSSCGACKFLRRKCAEGCVFAPYFSYDQGAIHFAAVHKVFGASNVSKLLANLPVQHRGEAAVTISYEAQARMRDPVYGCVAHVFALQQQVRSPYTHQLIKSPPFMCLIITIYGYCDCAWALIIFQRLNIV